MVCFTVPYVVKYDVYKVKLLLLRLVMETSNHVPIKVQVSSRLRCVSGPCVYAVSYFGASRMDNLKT